MKNNHGITLIALVITIIVLLILATISIATLTGENGVLTKADTAKKQTEIEDAREQAKLDIATEIAERIEAGQSTDLSNSDIKNILTGKEYVNKEEGQPGEDRFKTRKSGYEILYSDLYQAPKKKIKFTIVSIKAEYAGTYEVEEGTTWTEFFSTHNPEKYDSNYGDMVKGWWYRISDNAIALWDSMATSNAFVSMLMLVNADDKAIQYKDDLIKARYIFYRRGMAYDHRRQGDELLIEKLVKTLAICNQNLL